MKFSRKSFFKGHREIFGPSQQLQVDGLNFLLARIEADAAWESVEELSYFFATIRHETGVQRDGVEQTYQPIRELRGRKGTEIRAIQDKYWLSGYYGRGYCQLTWEANYRRASNLIGSDLVANPDLALDPEYAYLIASVGMRQGLFTGKKLSDYIKPGTKVDYRNARRIVNGLDKAEQIAKIACQFEAILSTSAQDAKAESIAHVEAAVLSPQEKKPIATEATVVVQAEVPKETNPKEKAEVSGPKSWIAAVTTFMASAGAGVFSWAKGASTEIVVAFFASAALVGVVYVVARYWYRNKENQRLADVQLAREKMAQEITLMKMRSAMQQESNAVEVAH